MNRPFPPSRKTQGSGGTARTTTVPVHQALQRHESFAQFAYGIDQITALGAQLRDALPPYLHAEVEPARLHNGVLVVLARHNALAARLRHLEPSIVKHLQGRGWAVETMRVRIRPLSDQPAAPAPKQARLSTVGLQCLAELAVNLEPSPLKDALDRMVTRHRGA